MERDPAHSRGIPLIRKILAKSVGTHLPASMQYSRRLGNRFIFDRLERNVVQADIGSSVSGFEFRVLLTVLNFAFRIPFARKHNGQ